MMEIVRNYGLFFLVLTSFSVWAEDVEHKTRGLGPGIAPNGQAFANSSEETVDAFSLKSIFETMNSQVENCTSPESFTQSINNQGPTTRKVDAMPEGYFKGMLISFARNMCSMEDGYDPNKIGMEGVLMGPPLKGTDTLKWYGEEAFPSIQATDEATRLLIQNYSLILPLGMIETDARYWKGLDESRGDLGGGEDGGGTPAAETIEAGLFQVSANSLNLGHGIMKDIYEDLKSRYAEDLKEILSSHDVSPANPTDKRSCLLDTFKEGLSDAPDTTGAVEAGGGSSAEFQKIMKACPAFAADYMAALARVSFEHNGPLKRKYAQPRESCIQIMDEIVQQKDSVCNGIENYNDPNELADVNYQPGTTSIDRGDLNFDTEQFQQEAKKAGLSQTEIQSSIDTEITRDQNLQQTIQDQQKLDLETKEVKPTPLPGEAESGGIGASKDSSLPADKTPLPKEDATRRGISPTEKASQGSVQPVPIDKLDAEASLEASGREAPAAQRLDSDVDNSFDEKNIPEALADPKVIPNSKYEVENVEDGLSPDEKDTLDSLGLTTKELENTAEPPVIKDQGGEDDAAVKTEEVLIEEGTDPLPDVEVESSPVEKED